MKFAVRLSTLLAAAAGALAASTAAAHSASDAYLNLTVEAPGGTREAPRQSDTIVLQGQWDIAIRDLDFVMHLDDDGDGQVTWRELKRHRAAIEQYAYAQLAFSGGAGNACDVKPTRQMIDGHADGAYVALFFDVACRRPPRTLALDYRLFFSVDPSHRGIFVLHSNDNVSTALLSPQNARIDLNVGPQP